MMNDIRTERENRIGDLIARLDPMGLLALGAPSDEYQPQARAIAAGIERCHSLQECQEIIWGTFVEHFGESAGPMENFRDLAIEVYEGPASDRW